MSSKTQDPVERAEKRVGTLLCNKWRLDALLGVGGMGAVYAATHRNQKRVAIKMLHAEASAVHDIRERFLREGYLANSVGHEGIVSVHDDDVAEDGSVFLVLELLEGETLEERATRKGGILSPSEVLSVADQLLDVLAAAHDRKLVHRDLKPDNLFLTNAGILKVLDFGIARLNEPDGTSSSSTRTGSLLGTPAFMAPEQARGRWKDVDAQSDLWSAGATLFALLTGRPPHEGGTSNEVLALAITQQAPSLASLRPDLPAPVTDLIDKSLSYDKQDRYPSARVMQEAVRGAYRTILGNAEPRPPALSIVDGGLPVEGVRFSNPSPASARTISERAAAFDHESLEPVPTKRPARIWIVGVTVLAALALAFGWRSWTAARSAGAEAPGDRSLEETSTPSGVHAPLDGRQLAEAPSTPATERGAEGGPASENDEVKEVAEPSEEPLVEADETPPAVQKGGAIQKPVPRAVAPKAVPRAAPQPTSKTAPIQTSTQPKTPAPAETFDPLSRRR